MAFASRLKKLASETVIYGVSSIVARLINFVLVPFYTNVFDPEDYGVVGVVFTVVIVLNVLYQYGMESAYLKFASGEEGRAQRRTTFSTATWSLLGTSAVWSLVLVLGHEAVADLAQLDASWSHLFYYVAAFVLLDALTLVPFAELRLQNRPWRFATIRLASVGLNVGLNLVLILGFGWGIEAIFVANIAASGFALLMHLPTYFDSLRLRFSALHWKMMVGFGLPFIASGLAAPITERFNIFFLAVPPMARERIIELYGTMIQLNPLTATDANYGEYVQGAFNAIWKMAIFMMLVAQMFRYAWQPFFLQHAEDPDAKPLFARVLTLFTAVALFVVLAVSFFVQELVAFPLPGGRTLIAPSYWMALPMVPVALLAYLFQGWYYTFSAGVYIERKTTYLLYCALSGSATALLVNILLVPQYGVLAAAWAVTLAYMVMATILLILTRRIYPVPYEWGRVLSACGLAAVLFAVWYLVPLAQTWWAELLLLAGYVAGLFGLRIVPLAALKRLLHRKQA